MITGNYDRIGDIHGHAEVLHRLLREMDHRDDGGAFAETSRRFIRDDDGNLDALAGANFGLCNLIFGRVFLVVCRHSNICGRSRRPNCSI
jgi:hypothetical protein